MEWLEPDDDKLFQIKYNLERLASNIHPTPDTYASSTRNPGKFGVITKMWAKYNLCEDGTTPENIKWYVSIKFADECIPKISVENIIIKEEDYGESYNADGFYGSNYEFPATCDI